MCGIFAAITPPNYHCSWANESLKLQKHRGPDGQGIAQIELPWGNVTLAQVRLKITDQNHIQVPWVESGISIAYNGEIYNWRELRDQLPGPWKTQCDVEVLARAWATWGPAILEKLNGMFAFILVDHIRNQVHAVRDRAGEKPLYIIQRGDITYLASEIKALPVEKKEGFCLGLETLEFDFDSITPVAGVVAINPGYHISWSPIRSDRRWWFLPAYEPDEEAENHLFDLLVDAVQIRAKSEVPLAVQLSGGLDSAIIQTIIKSNNLYCVTFPEVDNLSEAKRVSENITPVIFSREEMMEEFPRIAYHLDTPATWTAACQWFMNRKIAADGAKIVLSGEGADELFLGYSRYRVLHHLQNIYEDEQLVNYRPLINRTLGDSNDYLVNMLNRGNSDMADMHARFLLSAYGDGNYGDGNYGDGNNGNTDNLIRRMAKTDFYTTMQVLLRMADRMAMAHSIENRSPFFDYRLMELSTKLPNSSLIDSRYSKAALRRVATRLGVNSEIIDEKTKKGLFIPKSWGIGTWGIGTWDRKWFVELAKKYWRQGCLGECLCDKCQ